MKDTAIAIHLNEITARYPRINRMKEIWDDCYFTVMGSDSNKVDLFMSLLEKVQNSRNI